LEDIKKGRGGSWESKRNKGTVSTEDLVFAWQWKKN